MVERTLLPHASELHRLLDQASAQVYLLFDPCLRPIDADSPLWPYTRDRPHYQLREVPNGPQRAKMPMLWPLDLQQAGDCFLLQESLRIAQDELDPAKLCAGQGRCISAWLECPLGMPQLAKHIENRMQVRRPNGLPTVFYWSNPAILWSLWPILNPKQQVALLGPIQRLHFLTPGGDLQTLDNPEPSLQPPPLEMGIEQLQHIQQIGILNALLREWNERPTNPQAWVRLRDTALAALAQARALGLSEARDQRVFAECMLELGPAFASHPRIAAYFKQAQANSFAGFIADLSEADWQRLRHDLALPTIPGQAQ